MKLTSTYLLSLSAFLSLTSLTAAVFPCCLCSTCTCGTGSCPKIKLRARSPPEMSWASNNLTKDLALKTGCGESYSADSCLTFIHQLLQSLEPALQAHSSSEFEEEGPCCGPTCSDASCLTYLTTTVGHLQAPIGSMIKEL